VPAAEVVAGTVVPPVAEVVTGTVVPPVAEVVAGTVVPPVAEVVTGTVVPPVGDALPPVGVLAVGTPPEAVDDCVPPAPPCGPSELLPEQAIRPTSANNGNSEKRRMVGMIFLNYKGWNFRCAGLCLTRGTRRRVWIGIGRES
jgi:hypothetical protein